MNYSASGPGQVPAPRELLEALAQAARTACAREDAAYEVWDASRTNRRQLFEWGRAAGVVDGLIAALELVRATADPHGVYMVQLREDDRRFLAGLTSPRDRRRPVVIGPAECDRQKS